MNRKIRSRPYMILLAVLSIQTVYAVDPLPFAHATPTSQGISPHALMQLTEEVDGYIRDEKIVGAELLVIKNRKAVLHKGFGWRNRDKDIPMGINTIFNIRSMTKPITGTTLQMLIEDNKLCIDDPVAKHLWSFDNEKSRAITVKHLLTHRSGLGWLTGTSQASLQMIANSCGELGPHEFLPGTSFRYSNGGSDIMGAIIEETARMPLDAFMNERIFQPLGMKETFGLHRGTDPRLERCASRYRNQSGPLECVWKPSDGAQFKFMRGSQGLGSTPMDYARFLALWLDKGMAGNKRLLSAKTVSRSLTPVSLADLTTGFPHTKVYYGYQWMLYRKRQESVPSAWGHGGSDGTFAWVWPHKDLMVLYFSQCTNTITGSLLEQAIDRLLIHPENNETKAPEKLQPYIGFYWSSEANMYRAIVSRDAELVIEVPGSTLATLRATSNPDRWVSAEQTNLEFKFARNEEGNVVALIPPAYTKIAPQMRFDVDPNLPSVDQLVAQHLQAHGTNSTGTLGVYRLAGTMDLKAQKMSVTNRLVSDGQGRSREEIKLGETVLQTVVCNGDRVKILDSTGTCSTPTGIEQEQTILARCAVVIGDWREFYQRLQLIRRVQVKGKDTYYCTGHST
ncbi:MAG: beta-lactamase family protein [Phycisphaeraceae bacterium]|nr:beta-lactamase family protein [Phycisphaeraceae bacterium]